MINIHGTMSGDFGQLSKLGQALARAESGALESEIAQAAATAASAAARSAYSGPVATGAMRDATTTLRADGGALRTAPLERYQEIQAQRSGIQAEIESAAAQALETIAAEVLAKELGK